MAENYWKVKMAKVRAAKEKKKKKVTIRGKGVGRPPKKWFYKTLKKVKKYEDTIQTPEAVVGHIWHHELSAAKRREIIRRYEGK